MTLTGTPTDPTTAATARKGPSPREVWTQRFASYKGDLTKIVLQPIEQPLVRVTKRDDHRTRLVSLCGFEIADIPSKGVQAFCKVASIPGWTNKSKFQMCQIIVAFVTNTPTASAQIDTPATQRQLSNAYFLLINILFHPCHVALYANFGKQPGRDVLDKGKIANQELFEKALVMFNNVANAKKKNPADLLSVLEESSDDEDGDSDHTICKLLFLKDLPNVDPSNVAPIRTWQELSRKVGTLHREFREVYTCWKRSGEHREMSDSHEGMCLDVDASLDTTNRPPQATQKFEVTNMKVLYYFQFLRNRKEIFIVIQKVLPNAVKRSSTAGTGGGVAARESTDSQSTQSGGKRSSTYRNQVERNVQLSSLNDRMKEVSQSMEGWNQVEGRKTSILERRNMSEEIERHENLLCRLKGDKRKLREEIIIKRAKEAKKAEARKERAKKAQEEQYDDDGFSFSQDSFPMSQDSLATTLSSKEKDFCKVQTQIKQLSENQALIQMQYNDILKRSINPPGNADVSPPPFRRRRGNDNEEDD